uniref:NADH-ubiquinone oxidoreductase chain 2 n=1 Tax=Notospermus geniculatus TaxID=416868 RepID=A0A4Y5RV79_9BILA|nr:NADH dehydrogenase subunit 2 [Notospermus geniculatus]QCZ36419.1 NADH dehydrogenase subunit 2 [Notospermus geniculatus]
MLASVVLGFPFSFGFGFLCVLGSLVSVSSGDWLGVWLGLEVNLLGFVPLMLQGVGGQSVESSVKYFVVQALGSGFLLLGGLSLGGSLFWFFGGHGGVGGLFVFFGLVLKLGVAPLHWWVPSVMGGLTWFGCGVLVTWQKLAPFLVLLSLCGDFLFLFLLLGGLSSLVGGVLGIGQVQVRLLMGYSSISHWGWVLGTMCFSVLGSVFYYFFYFLVSLAVFFLLGVGGVWRVGFLGGLVGGPLVLGLLSLGGLPPFSGFLPKWVGLQVVLGGGGVFLSFFLVLGSVFSLYFYLSFLFVFFVGGGVRVAPFFSGGGLGLSLATVVLLGCFPLYEILFYLFF